MVSPKVYERFINYSLDKILSLQPPVVFPPPVKQPPVIVVNGIGELAITVEEVYLTATPNKWLNETAVGAALLQVETIEDHDAAVLYNISADLDRMTKEEVLTRYREEYERTISKKSVILIPINEAQHFTLAVARPDCNYIEFYDSYFYCKAPPAKLDKIKFIVESCCGVKLNLNIRKDLPKQRDGTSCGIYVIIFAQHAVSGRSLDDINDSRIPAIRREIAETLIKQSTTTTFQAYREEVCNSDDDQVDDQDQVVIDDSLVDSGSNQLFTDPMMSSGMLTLMDNRRKSISYLFYVESVQLASVTTETFRGYDQFGVLITYNTNGIWFRMLSITEMVLYFSPTNLHEGRSLLTSNITKEIVESWVTRCPKEGETPTAFMFSYDTGGNYKLVRKAAKKFGINMPFNSVEAKARFANRKNKVISFLFAGQCSINS